MGIVGTYDITTLLAQETATVTQYGTDTTAEVLQRYLEAHSTKLADALSAIAQPTTDREARAGVAASTRGMKADEYARGVGQRAKGGADLGFPLDKFIYRVGWTFDFMKAATPADVARKTIAIATGNRQDVMLELRRALLTPTNRTVTDEHVDPNQSVKTLAVKALANADSFPMPASPYGETFDSATHQHYTGIGWTGSTSAQKAAAVDALVSNVAEHYTEADVKIILASTNSTELSSLAEFVPATPVFVNPVGATDGTAGRQTTGRTDNKLIGYWRGNYEIWVKPWATANYILAINYNAPEKALKYRERSNAALRGLRMVDTHVHAPLTTEFLEHEFGFGAWGRTAAAVLYLSNATYAAPTF